MSLFKMSTTEEKLKMSWFIKDGLKWYHQFFINVLKAGPVPRHVALIMDGTRRYAKKSNTPLGVAHYKLFDRLSQMIHLCKAMGIQEMTAYTLSIENLKRSSIEVELVMKFLVHIFDLLLEQIEDFNESGTCLRVIGNLSLIPDEIKARIAKAVLLTRNNTKFTVTLAISYASQNEIENAFEEIRQGVQSNKLEEEDITEELISKCLYSGKSSEPDVIIRTSGEVRLSNFLLWQSKNTNIIFCKVFWPEFSIFQFMWCIFQYQMYYSDQERTRKLLGNEDFKNNERVEAFLLELEQKRFNELKMYASQI